MFLKFRAGLRPVRNPETPGYEVGMSLSLRAGTAAVLAALLGTAALAAASPAITAAIAARKANYKEIGGAFKTINDEIKSGSPDFNSVRPLARDIAARSALQLKHFPKGSGPESGVKTRAKPAIWKDYASFSKLQKDMVASANTLSAAATARDVAALSKARTALGATCKSCHDKFREEG